MKRSQLIGIIVIALAIGVLISLSGEFDSYSSFEDAKLTPEKSAQVIGQLAKDKEIYYNPEKDPNYFSFYVTDDEGTTQKVILKAAKPQDFERSESIVLTGKMRGEEFIASDMLMKCPSKYTNEEEEIKVKAQL